MGDIVAEGYLWTDDRNDLLALGSAPDLKLYDFSSVMITNCRLEIAIRLYLMPVYGNHDVAFEQPGLERRAPLPGQVDIDACLYGERSRASQGLTQYCSTRRRTQTHA
jgi:hypothetical protein